MGMFDFEDHWLRDALGPAHDRLGTDAEAEAVRARYPGLAAAAAAWAADRMTDVAMVRRRSKAGDEDHLAVVIRWDGLLPQAVMVLFMDRDGPGDVGRRLSLAVEGREPPLTRSAPAQAPGP